MIDPDILLKSTLAVVMAFLSSGEERLLARVLPAKIFNFWRRRQAPRDDEARRLQRWRSCCVDPVLKRMSLLHG